MSYGLTEDGFIRKSLDQILADIEADERDLISETLNLLATSVLGQINGVYVDRLDEIWEIALAIYRATYPDSASGEALDQVASITGAVRLPATKSTITLDQIHLENGITLPIGKVVSVGENGERFVTTEEVINSATVPKIVSVEAESQNTGPIQGLATTINTIQTPVSGWKASAGITSGNDEPFDLDDGQTLLIKVDGGSEQTATFNTGDFVDIDNATAAEIAAVIATDITGVSVVPAFGTGDDGYVWIETDSELAGNSIQITGGTANTELDFDTDIVKGFNSLDADLGRDIESDADFRIRREELLSISGAGTLESIRSNVRALDDVQQAFVFENITLVTDGDGLPGKSFEVVVAGGDDNDIAEEIFLTKPVGIESYGTTTIAVEDSQGISHDIKFSRPDEIDIYVDVTVQIDSSSFPSDGEDQIKAALVAAGDALQIGEDVIYFKFAAVPFEISGVEDVTVFEIDDVTPPTGTSNIVIDTRELAVFDTSRITVTTV